MGKGDGRGRAFTPPCARMGPVRYAFSLDPTVGQTASRMRTRPGASLIGLRLRSDAGGMLLSFRPPNARFYLVRHA